MGFEWGGGRGGGERISGVSWHTEGYNRLTSSSHGWKVATGRMEITVRAVIMLAWHFIVIGYFGRSKYRQIKNTKKITSLDLL